MHQQPRPVEVGVQEGGLGEGGGGGGDVAAVAVEVLDEEAAGAVLGSTG